MLRKLQAPRHIRLIAPSVGHLSLRLQPGHAREKAPVKIWALSLFCHILTKESNKDGKYLRAPGAAVFASSWKCPPGANPILSYSSPLARWEYEYSVLGAPGVLCTRPQSVGNSKEHARDRVLRYIPPWLLVPILGGASNQGKPKKRHRLKSGIVCSAN